MEIYVWEASDSEDLLDATLRWAMSGRALFLYIRRSRKGRVEAKPSIKIASVFSSGP